MEKKYIQQVETKFTQINVNKSGWNQPFNQCLFMNFDTVNPVFINQLPIAPAQTVGGQIMPNHLLIGLNVGEVNVTDYTFDFGASSTANLRIMFTQYLGVEANQIAKYR